MRITAGPTIMAGQTFMVWRGSACAPYLVGAILTLLVTPSVVPRSACMARPRVRRTNMRSCDPPLTLDPSMAFYGRRSSQWAVTVLWQARAVVEGRVRLPEAAMRCPAGVRCVHAMIAHHALATRWTRCAGRAVLDALF